jgi:hypothetical protein
MHTDLLWLADMAIFAIESNIISSRHTRAFTVGSLNRGFYFSKFSPSSCLSLGYISHCANFARACFTSVI